jgi:hypothetical protein
MSETAAALHHGCPFARKRHLADIRPICHGTLQIVTEIGKTRGFAVISVTI